MFQTFITFKNHIFTSVVIENTFILDLHQANK